MNKNVECYFNSARRYLLGEDLNHFLDGFKIKLAAKSYLFRGAVPPFNAESTDELCEYKYITSHILEKNGLPVAKQVKLVKKDFDNQQIEEKLSPLKFPLVLKPVIGKLGRNVICGIESINQVYEYAKDADDNDEFLAEEFYSQGNSYRVLLLNGKVLGLVQRWGAKVISDGVHNIKQLIELENNKRHQLCDTLKDIEIDQECLLTIAKQGYSLDDIPIEGKTIKIHHTCNASRGGTYINLKNNQICKANIKLLKKAAKVLNLNIVGFDLECPSLNQAITKTGGIIIEANAKPSIRIHEDPISGSKVTVTRKAIQQLILKHPIAYLFHIAKHPKLKLYIRALIVIAIYSFAYLSFR